MIFREYWLTYFVVLFKKLILIVNFILVVLHLFLSTLFSHYLHVTLLLLL